MEGRKRSWLTLSSLSRYDGRCAQFWSALFSAAAVFFWRAAALLDDRPLHAVQLGVLKRMLTRASERLRHYAGASVSCRGTTSAGCCKPIRFDPWKVKCLPNGRNTLFQNLLLKSSVHSLSGAVRGSRSH